MRLLLGECAMPWLHSFRDRRFLFADHCGVTLFPMIFANFLFYDFESLRMLPETWLCRDPSLSFFCDIFRFVDSNQLSSSRSSEDLWVCHSA
jgi:hypothetical protein